MPRKKKTEAEKEAKKSEGKEKAEQAEKVEAAEVTEDKKKILERAKQLEKGIEEKVTVEEIKAIEPKLDQKEAKLFVPLDDYVKAGVHLGTKVISGDMRSYVYRRRADGLAILNTNTIDKKLHEACEFISTFPKGAVILVCKREAGWTAANMLSKTTGIRVFTKKYPAGMITNSALQDFFEPSLIIISDPWLDKNALKDARNIKVPVVGLCDSNNLIGHINFVIPCNNKSNKSIGLVFFVIAKEYCKKHGIEFNATLNDFAGEEIEEIKQYNQ